MGISSHILLSYAHISLVTTQTTTTVGYGDEKLSSKWSKSFAVVYALLSVVIVARALTSLTAASRNYFALSSVSSLSFYALMLYNNRGGSTRKTAAYVITEDIGYGHDHFDG